MAQALLLAGIPSSLVVFALSSGASTPSSSEFARFESDTRRKSSAVLSNAAPVQNALVGAPSSAISEPLPSSGHPVLPPSRSASEAVTARDSSPQVPVGSGTLSIPPSGGNDFHLSGAPGSGSLAEELTPDQQFARDVNAELSKTPTDGLAVTTILDLMATSASPRELKSVLERVLTALDDPRQRWKTDGDKALLTQGVGNLLARIEADRVNVFKKADQSSDVQYSEQDFQSQQQRLASLRRQSLARLAQDRLDELFALVSNGQARRYDDVLGSALFTMSVHHVGLLRENADSGTFTLASTRVRCLFIDMSADLSHDPARSDQVARLTDMTAELDRLVRR